MSSNITTFFLIIIIIIVLILVGGFIVLNKDVFFKKTDKSLVENFVQENIVIGISETENTQESIDTIQNDDLETNSQTDVTDSMLIQIVNRYNSCSATQEMRQQGYTQYATNQGNNINIISSGDGLYFNVNFVCQDNILSTEVRVDATESREIIAKIMLGITLLDSVAQIKGYPERTLTNALNEDAAMYYTLENEGVEMEVLGNNEGMAIKIDLDSDLSFLNS